ncbi:glycosyltransferase [Paenarthrobacter nitroguajacolicus]|uniref:glycosyltransferase n=1 Tax=Paenarthrobacter nitroguajacolicus TaxID=211146 RepID=UPI003AF3B54C
MRRIDFIMHKDPTLTLATNSATLAFVRSLGITSAKQMLADGIQPERIAAATNDKLGDPVELVWLGRMVASKRADVAIGLLSSLHKRGIPARLTLIGDGPERPTLERKVKDLELSGFVEFSGRIPWEQTFDYYDRSHFLVFTSMRDSSCPAVVEAAARGLPSLCVRHQGVASLVPDSVAFGPENFSSIARLQEDLADVVANFQFSPSEYRKASQNALAFARSQTWGQKVQTVLRDLEVRRAHGPA